MWKSEIPEERPPLITWILSENKQVSTSETNITNKKSNLGLCYCPGTNYKDYYNYDVKKEKIELDLNHFKQYKGVEAIICLIDKRGLGNLDLSLYNYKEICRSLNIKFIHYPVRDFDAPKETPEEIDKKLISPVKELLTVENKTIVMHCRGGVGRSGLIAALILTKLGHFSDTESAIEYLRKIRNPQCVESGDQEEYIDQYIKYLKSSKCNQSNSKPPPEKGCNCV